MFVHCATIESDHRRLTARYIATRCANNSTALGMAGSPEHNPYVAALYELQLVTHRRVYRMLYEFCEHVGIDFSPYPSWIWKRPEQVDRGYLFWWRECARSSIDCLRRGRRAPMR